SCLASSDNDKVHSHSDTTCLHEERVANLIAARPVPLYICINANADGGGRLDVYDEDDDHLASDPLGGLSELLPLPPLLVFPDRRPVVATTTRLFNTDTLRDYDDDKRDIGLERRPKSPATAHHHCIDSFPSLQDAKSRFLCDAKVFNLFNLMWSLSQVLNQMA
ncbi:unnamed protein product, partial [Musa textilis]